MPTGSTLAGVTAPSGFRLGIDFGTTHTVASLQRPDGRLQPLLFASSPLIPSAVFAEPGGQLLTGQDAVRSARLDPSRYEPNVKRRIDDGTILLGTDEYPVAELIAARLDGDQVLRNQLVQRGAVVAEIGAPHSLTSFQQTLLQGLG